MKRILTALAITYLAALTARAQSELSPLPLPRIEPLQVNLLQFSAKQSPGRTLPDDPIPVLPSLQDGPAPCPKGVGKSCALLGGRAYFSDPGHMTQHDLTWGKAARNPLLIVGGLVLMAATVADAEGTQSCLHAETCKEENPLFGSHPSRARVYGISIPLGLVSYAIAAHLKQKGDGNYAFAVMSVGSAAHFYEAASGFTQGHR